MSASATAASSRLLLIIFLSTMSTLRTYETAPSVLGCCVVNNINMTSQLNDLKASQGLLNARLEDLTNASLNIASAVKKLTSVVCLLNHNKGCGVLVQQQLAGQGAPFDREWRDFKYGFGDVEGNYWIGNDRLHAITQKGKCKLRIDLQAKVNYQWYFAEYNYFIVEDERSDYRLLIGGYQGDAGDGFHSSASYKVDDKSCLNWMPFSSSNIDNDRWDEDNCASSNSASNGAFWFNSCGRVYINGGSDSVYGFSWIDLPVGSNISEKQLLVSRLTLHGCV